MVLQFIFDDRRIANSVLTAGRRIAAEAAVADPQISELVTVPNVPMVSTGIDYPTSTGLITLTEQHLRDLVASQDDPAIHPPRTKIGHSDPRFNARVTPDGDVLDGEPSLGTWMNLRLGDNDQTVYGDLVGCPRWFAQIAATAYPSRSIEGNFDVETVTGHKWSLAIDAVAMLGVIGPGITTLADLPILFSVDGPEDVQVIEAKEGEPMSVRRPVAAAGTVQAQAQVDDIRRQYYDSLEGSQFWWWIRAMYVDPGELIVDDDEGGLYRVPFTTSDDGSVTFDEPVPVKIQYVDQPQDEVAAAIRASVATSLHTEVAASYQSREQSRPGGSMDRLQVISALRARGVTPEQLPDDADDAAIVAYLSEPVTAASAPAPTASTPPPEATPPASSGGTHTEGGEGAPDAQPTQPAAITSTAAASAIPSARPVGLPDGTIVVDRETWEDVARQAREGADLAARTRDQERDNFLNAAIKAGKFPPSRKEHWLNAWTADPEGTRGVIDSLQPGLIPVEARGTAGTGKDESVAASDVNSYDQDWLTPSERARINLASAQHAGTVPTPMVVQGGD